MMKVAARCAVVGCDSVEDETNNLIQILRNVSVWMKMRYRYPKHSIVKYLSRSLADHCARFPYSDDVALKKWIKCTGRGGEEWRPGEGDGICGLHFRKPDSLPTKYLPNMTIEDTMVWDVKYLERVSGALWTSPVLAEPRSAADDELTAEFRSELQRVARLLDDQPERFQRRLALYHRLLAHVKAQRVRTQLPAWVRLLAAARDIPPVVGGAARGGAGPQWAALAARARATRVLAPGPPGEAGAVWRRGVELARRRLALLAAVGDDAGALAPHARPAWHVEDALLLLAPDEDAVALPAGAAARYMPRTALALLFELVQQYELEGEEPAPAERWEGALRAYRARHRSASVLLLQRRWYELKRAVHAASHAPDLHEAVLARYPRLAAAPPPSWRAAVRAGRVLDGPAREEPPAAPVPPRLTPPLLALLPRYDETSLDSDEDDVVLIEREIDTLEISDDESPPPARRANETKSEIDVKLTMMPVVELREASSVRGWKVRNGRFVSLASLAVEELAPPPRAAAPSPRPSLVSRILFEEDAQDDLKAVLASAPLSDATLEISYEEEEEEPRPVRLPDTEQLRRTRRPVYTAQGPPPGAGAGAGEEREAGARGEQVVCCWALRDRVHNAARVRNALAAGRAPPVHRLPYHEVHCPPPCRCCCAGAQWGWAGAALAAKQAALDVRLAALADPARRPPAPPPVAPRPRSRSLPRRPPDKASSSKRKRRRPTTTGRAASPSPASPLLDPLQEWIRQRNITARFFDLNLRPPPEKRPANTVPRPEPTPAAPAPADVAPPVPPMAVSDDEERSSASPAPPAVPLAPGPALPAPPPLLPAPTSVPRASRPPPMLTSLLRSPAVAPPPPRLPVRIVTMSRPRGAPGAASPVLVIRPMQTSQASSPAAGPLRPIAPAPAPTVRVFAGTVPSDTPERAPAPAPAPGPARVERVRFVCGVGGGEGGGGGAVQVETVSAALVAWSGQPFVVAVSRLSAPWGPLLGWYLVSRRPPASPPALADLDWWVVAGARVARVVPRPPSGVAPLWGVRDAREGARLARAGAPLLALHAAAPLRVLRVGVQRVRDERVLQCECAELARRLAAAFNAADDDDLADVVALDDD